LFSIIKRYKWPIFLVGIIILHSWWSYSGRENIKKHTPLNIREVSEVGNENFNTNIVCVQPYMQLQDYASLEVFYNKIDKYFSAIEEEGLLHENTIVVFPEHIGTPLALVDEKEITINSGTVDAALFFAFASNFWQIGFKLAKEPESSIPSIFLKSKSEKMGEVFNFVFSSMAKKYKAYVIPGTIMLGSPIVEDGKLKSDGEAFQNISVLYQPEGKALQNIIYETNLSATEKIIASPEENSQVPTFATPAGKTLVILGDDIWNKDQLDENLHDADLIINPFHSIENLENNGKSYFKSLNISEPFKTNISVANNLIKTLSEKKHTSISVFLRGELFEQLFYGKTYMSYKEEIITGFEVEGASIISLGIN